MITREHVSQEYGDGFASTIGRDEEIAKWRNLNEAGAIEVNRRDVDALRVQVMKMAKVLAFYADKSNWLGTSANGMSGIFDRGNDKELLEPHEDYCGWFGGRRAREVLALLHTITGFDDE